ncbi:hypothetical protein [Pontibacterium sp.]|uniref:hypothetical protein n=1 Tax=Pontibacterium sp. TaxID=2036026 RepID=UPI00351763FB
MIKSTCVASTLVVFTLFTSAYAAEFFTVYDMSTVSDKPSVSICKDTRCVALADTLEKENAVLKKYGLTELSFSQISDVKGARVNGDGVVIPSDLGEVLHSESQAVIGDAAFDNSSHSPKQQIKLGVYENP